MNKVSILKRMELSSFLSIFKTKPPKLETPKPIPQNFDKEKEIFMIAESLFVKVLSSFPQLDNIGVVLDDKKENGFLVTAGFNIRGTEALHFVSIPLKKDDNIQNKALQKSIEEAFLAKVKEVLN